MPEGKSMLDPVKPEDSYSAKTHLHQAVSNPPEVATVAATALPANAPEGTLPSEVRPEIITWEKLVEAIQASGKAYNMEMIQKAYDLANNAHRGVCRRSGEPYICHPLAVARLVLDLGMDTESIAAALLHDVVEDTPTTLDDLKAAFGEEVALLVDGVTKLTKIQFSNIEELQAENLRKMLLAMSRDVRVMIIKLCDRLHNMRTGDAWPEQKRRDKARETMEVYAPIANRLGILNVKEELEDRSLHYLDPVGYNEISKMLSERAGEEFLASVSGVIEQRLEESGIEGATIKRRVKSIYGIYRKTIMQNKSFDEIYDIYAVRIILDTLAECYSTLGLIHDMYHPLPNRFKDYISTPKPNGYQSLHTTIIGPDAERIEVQIRTEEMHRQAEHGIAAHWLYKEHGRVNSKDLAQFSWLNEIFERQRDEASSKEFMHSLKMDLFHDEVYVYTPAGDVKELPEGATPLDFAFHIHTKVGQHCAGAKVNGRLVPLGTPLKNGDTCEIITEPNREPNRDWLKMVKTAKARNRIQHYLRTEERTRALNLGRELLEKEGRKVSINVQKADKEGQLTIVAQEMNFDSDDDLYAAVGYAHITPRKVLNRLYAILHPGMPAPGTPKQQIQPQAAENSTEQHKPSTYGVSIAGVDGVLMRFAKCCNPVPGDPIVGYISRGQGITVHRADCPNVPNMEPERIISVHWDGEVVEQPYDAGIFILAKNVSGMLASIARAIAEKNINISNLSVKTLIDGRSNMHLVVQVRNATELYDTIEAIRKLPGILEVVRDDEYADTSEQTSKPSRP